MSDPIPYDWIQTKWNEAVKGRLGKTIRVLTSDRRKKIADRWQEWVKAGLNPQEVFETILLTMRYDRFHSDRKMMRGEEHQTWHPTIDYAMRSDAKAMSLYETGCEIRERFEAKDARQEAETQQVAVSDGRPRDQWALETAYLENYHKLSPEEQGDLSDRAYRQLSLVQQAKTSPRTNNPRSWHWIQVKTLMDAEGLAP
jgi:hypothetical protein